MAVVAAHVAASRYDHQIIEFLRTAQQLELLVARYRRTELGGPELVDGSEGVISIETQGWMSRWAAPD